MGYRSAMDNEGVAPPAYPIESVDKALRLLTMLQEQSFIRVAEAGETLGVARSTAHRLLAMLQYHGFVAHDTETHAYRPGPRLIEIGLGAVRDMNIRTIGLGPIERLSRELGETVHIAILAGAEVLFVAAFESASALRAADRTGWRLPATATAAGKVILSQMEPDDVRQILPDQLAAPTPASITNWTELESEIAQARRQGYATNFGESEKDLVAVAAPILDLGGRVRGAVTVTSPSTRADRAWVRKVAPPTIATASAIGAQLA
jgi:IclR family transcriptional regulator, acetate operon repressor